ncbi:Starch-binding associating with outer membrane [Algoriphagus ornithinivorans]|uniref:Starch-binding associating with outer membrane n=1 Tax=Algoriphagus ornithinivorans TaxID=226506 RepID=A0A1I5GEK1_9BACT|nr:RagB/SusD family nutrient uptake outer membrane protein [Algoriphagus ornithinivorans]SFO33991.1 Starch-binding associating with outer membrane [Algoriphagus ornithinivorans]
MTKFSINKFKLAIAGAALMGAVSSCDVVDLTPANLIPDQEAFATPARVESAVLGVYESAQRGFYLGSVQRGYPFGAANVQQGDMRGEDMYNDQLFYEITYVGAYNPQTANNNGMWISLYRMINRANIVLEGLDEALSSGVLTQAQRDRYRGEMLFLRALAHHELLVHFARPYSDNPASPGVPYRTFAINDVPKVPDGEAVGRGTVGEDYQQLLSDLDEAESLLPNGAFSRASKGAAIGLKSRVKLHMEDWAGVIAEQAKITGQYAVTSSVTAPFFSGSTTDNVFSFINTEASNAGVNGALASMFGNPDLGARGLVKISPLIWRSSFWLAEDSRRTLLTTSNGTGVYTGKYPDAVTYSDPNPILRFAEVVLNAAEANAQLGNLDVAVTLLNSVRSRALPATVPAFTAAGLGGQAGVLDAIYKERRIEFLAEGKRWADIHRLSGAGVMNGVPAKATSRSITNINFYNTDRAIPTDHSILYTSNLFVWPIPLEEIQTNSTAPIEQNPGY